MSARSRFVRGFSLLTEGLRLANRSRLLLLFPLLAALIVVTLLFFVGGVLVDLARQGTDPFLVGGLTVLAVAVAGVGLSAVNVAEVATARAVFDGERPRLRDVIARTARSWEAIVLWGLVSTLVGVPFQVLETLSQPVGYNLSVRLLGRSWSSLSFFVVPELLDGASGLSEAFTGSERRFQHLWGQAGGVALGIDLLVLAGLGLVALALGLGVGDTATPIGTFVALVGGVALASLVVTRQAAVAITKAALHRYADVGHLPIGFETVQPESFAYGLRRR
jgi:hypothetical protein